MEDNKNIFLYNGIKSIYILKKIFGILQKRRTLKIIRYNKNIKSKLNINLNDYIEYQQIEIEIIPSLLNIKKEKYFLFINILDKNKSYCHIYFDNKNKEIKNFYINKKNKVSKIKILLDYKFDSFNNLFNGCRINKEIYFKTFDERVIKDMSYMFGDCTSLEKLDISKLKTSNVINMKAIFFNCISLTEIDLSNLNTSNVIDMSYMFSCCNSLKNINLSNLNAKNVIKILFYK